MSTAIAISPTQLQLLRRLIDTPHNESYVINPIKDTIDIAALRKDQAYDAHKAKAIFGQLPMENIEYQRLTKSINA